MEVVRQWFHDPLASVTLFIASVAGVFAVYQLRAQPAERRRRILNQMTRIWARSKSQREILLTNGDPLLGQGRAVVVAAAQAESLALAKDLRVTGGPSRLRAFTVNGIGREADSWGTPELGISFVAAHEVLASELKFRSLLWCIEQIRAAEQGRDSRADRFMITTARDLVNNLNDFLVDYESGAYPVRQMFGTLHRGLATTAAALLPYVWAGSLRGRWGRRALRIGIAAEHFNDVTDIHRISAIRWNWRSEALGAQEVVVHPSLTKDVFGREFPSTDRPAPPPHWAMTRIRVRAAYWGTVARVNPRPSIYFLSYGGRRLRRHRRAERDLSSLLLFSIDDERRALDFSWSVETLKQELEIRVRKQVRPGRQDESRSGAASSVT